MALRWGIIGSGRVCSDFTNALRVSAVAWFLLTLAHSHTAQSINATVTAVGASSVSKAEVFAKEHGGWVVMLLS